jgi:hypothetical protein
MTSAIDRYNADVDRLQAALDAMDSAFTWIVRGYALEMAVELGHWDREPTDADLQTLQVRAKGKAKRADGSRALVIYYLDRESIAGGAIEATCAMLEAQALQRAAV